MNAAVFEKWFRHQLLPNIAANSVIVMDNASYHSVQVEKKPCLSWRKQEIFDWLMNKGAQPKAYLTKQELLVLVKKHDHGKIYLIDTIAEDAGHRVVRLPPYHCQYNPIELIWGK